MKNFNEFLGIPFIHGGRSLQGVDCLGIVALIYKSLGWHWIEPSGKNDYKENWREEGQNLFIENYYKCFKRIKELKIYAAVLMKWESKVINHVGIYLSDDTIIHATKGMGVIKMPCTRLKNKIEGFYEYQFQK